MPRVVTRPSRGTFSGKPCGRPLGWMLFLTPNSWGSAQACSCSTGVRGRHASIHSPSGSIFAHDFTRRLHAWSVIVHGERNQIEDAKALEQYMEGRDNMLSPTNLGVAPTKPQNHNTMQTTDECFRCIFYIRSLLESSALLTIEFIIANLITAEMETPHGYARPRLLSSD